MNEFHRKAEVFTINDLVKALRQYPADLEIAMEDIDGRGPIRIQSIRWEQGGYSSWIQLSPLIADEEK